VVTLLSGLESLPKILPKQLEEHVRVLAEKIGERNCLNKKKLDQARDYIVKNFSSLNLNISLQTYQAKKISFQNIEATLPGKKGDIILVGAHYDSHRGSPGADDNASGVAAVLVLAERFRDLVKKRTFSKTLRFAAFVNEEHPFSLTNDMGSLVYAKMAKKRGDKIKAALVLEMLGCFTNKKKSQTYPLMLGSFYPEKGNFVAVLSNLKNRKFVNKVADLIKPSFPAERLVAPSFSSVVNRSDHWSFWKTGVPTLMITDTANFRNRHYHQRTDTWDTLNYEKMGKLVNSLEDVIVRLAC